MNKIICGLSMILIASISILLGASYNVYSEKEESWLILPKNVFENEFIQQVILIGIPTGSAFLTSRYITNRWQIRKEKLELQRKILGEVDSSIVNSLQILKNFDRVLWDEYTRMYQMPESLDKRSVSEKDDFYETIFPDEESGFPASKFKKEYDNFIAKYSEGTLELWKCSSTIDLYYDEKLFKDFDKIINSLEPAFLELRNLFNSRNYSEFDSFHDGFNSKIKAIEHQITKFKKDVMNSKIKKLNV